MVRCESLHVETQLNDNVRLTIDEYRNKLYQFIQKTKRSNSRLSSNTANTNVVVVSNPAPSTVAPEPQQPKSESFMRSNTNTFYNSSSSKHNQQQHQQQYDDLNDGGSSNELIVGGENYTKNNYSSSYNTIPNQQQQYDAKSLNESDDTSSTPTPPYQQQQTVAPQQTNPNHNRKKHPSDYQNPQTASASSLLKDSSNINLGVAAYTGNFFLEFNYSLKIESTKYFKRMTC